MDIVEGAEKRVEISSVGYHADPELLEDALKYWERMSGFRKERERCKRYTYGDQWCDVVEVDGERIREEDYIRRQGNMPLSNNLIRRLVRNVLGVFRSRWANPECECRDLKEEREIATMQRLLNYNLDINRMEEVYSRTMEEFLISGLAVHRKWFGPRGGVSDCWTDLVPANNFFCEMGSRDFRGWDASVVGEIHYMEFPALVAEFAGSEGDAESLRRIYAGADLQPGHRGCRVVEVWRKEYMQRYKCQDTLRGKYFVSEKRVNMPGVLCEWENREVWFCYFLGPAGEVLSKHETPYRHGGHPFIIKAYPFIDGEIHSFVRDVIDQQKFTNRLISMYDWTLRSSAKGVLLFPEGSIPEGSDINDVAAEWSRFNGVITYRPRAGVAMPQQVTSAVANSGISDLLNIQMKLMEDISGVNGALQGKLDSNSMSGTLYNQQTQNSMMSLIDLMKSFDGFIRDATQMDVSNILQFYDSRKIRSIVGDSSRFVDRFITTDNFRGNISDYEVNIE